MTKIRTKIVEDVHKVSVTSLRMGDIFIWNRRIYMFLQVNDDTTVTTTAYSFTAGEAVTLTNVSTVIPVKEAELIVRA